MKVTLIHGMDPNVSKPGGISPYVMNLLNALHEIEVQTTLVGVLYGKMADNYQFNFIPVVKNPKNGYDYLLNLLLKSPFLKISNSSIIHTQRPDDMFPFVFLNRKNPKVCTLHGRVLETISLKQPSPVVVIYKIVESFCLKHIDKLIAVDETTKQFYERLYPWLKNKITVIPIGIDLNKFKPMDKEEMRRKYGFDAKDKIIIYVGRLEREKNLDFLIKSFVLVKKNNPHTKLVLVGDGRERLHLKNLVDELELKDVIFMGAMEYDKIPEVLNCADVFALTSLYEGSPTVIKEAIACGVPVVSTDVGDVSNVIQNDVVGKIVDSDEKLFARAIMDMLQIDRDAIKNACTGVSKNFSFEKIADRTIEVYKEVIEK
jgi:glycosyltransferase involved in cell wall biosynthesis